MLVVTDSFWLLHIFFGGGGFLMLVFPFLFAMGDFLDDPTSEKARKVLFFLGMEIAIGLFGAYVAVPMFIVIAVGFCIGFVYTIVNAIWVAGGAFGEAVSAVRRSRWIKVKTYRRWLHRKLYPWKYRPGFKPGRFRRLVLAVVRCWELLIALTLGSLLVNRILLDGWFAKENLPGYIIYALLVATLLYLRHQTTRSQKEPT